MGSGGIAGVLDPADASKTTRPTHDRRAGLCDPQVGRNRPVRPRIASTIRIRGTCSSGNGRLALTMEGGHSHPRVAHALGDATGKEVMRALIDRVRGSNGVEIGKTFRSDADSDAAAAGARVE